MCAYPYVLMLLYLCNYVQPFHKFLQIGLHSAYRTENNINWVVRALNAYWLRAMVYEDVYHGYDKKYAFLLF